MKLTQTTFLVAALPTTTASSFSDLTYGSSSESASAILDAFLSKDTTTSIGNTENALVSLGTASEGGQNDAPNVCASSPADAKLKACYGEDVISCSDAIDCAFGEACFLNIVCEKSSTSSTTSSNRSDWQISDYVMLAKDKDGETMTLANGSFQTTAVPELEISQFSSSTTSISSKIESILQSIEEKIDNELFLYETPYSEWIPSTVYRFNGFFDGLRVMHSVGVAGKKMYLGANSPTDDFLGNGITEDESCEHCFMYGLVNVAAFLAQAMKETIRYNACDENSWDRVGSLEMYPISNSCGQLGQSYQDYHCSEEEKYMECPVDPDMTITAITHAEWWGAPGPLMCGPKSMIPQTGYWDYEYECNNPWASPPETCDVYENQKAGKAINDTPYPNAAGRTDVEGCCWWGRGVIQTSGVCNFGKLNYYLGKRAFLEGRDSRYPDIDFCRDPEIICRSEEHRELKWIAGFFYWVDQVQTYDKGGWNYIEELRRFVNEGKTGEYFINAVSGIVNRGCHNPPCGTGDLDGGPQRAENFFRILKELEFSFVDVNLNKRPIPAPTPVSVETTTTSTTTSPRSPYDVVSYVCNDKNLSIENVFTGMSNPSIDLSFDYEMHSDLDVTVSQALQEIKQSIISDIADRLGCTEATARRLKRSNGNVVGLMASGSDTPDPNAAGCMVKVDAFELSVCTPIKGEIKVFAEAGSSEEDLVNIGEYVKDTIKGSMDSGRYETSTVRRVTWIGDRDLYLEEHNSSPVEIQSEPVDTNTVRMKNALYSLAGICAFLLCLLYMIVTSKRRKGITHDEELAIAELMNPHREINNKVRHMEPPNAIQRRSEYLRAVQQGQPLQPPYALENEGTTSESENEDMYFQRRHSINRRDSRRERPSSTPAMRHSMIAVPRPPIQRNASKRQIENTTSQPPMIIGEMGHFYVKDNSRANAPQKQAEPEEILEPISYRPQSSSGGVKSESSSEEEEEQVPIRPPRHQHTHIETNNPRTNIEQHQRRTPETWAGPRSDANEMSKAERQKRIERARSKRRNIV